MDKWSWKDRPPGRGTGLCKGPEVESDAVAAGGGETEEAADAGGPGRCGLRPGKTLGDSSQEQHESTSSSPGHPALPAPSMQHTPSTQLVPSSLGAGPPAARSQVGSRSQGEMPGLSGGCPAAGHGKGKARGTVLLSGTSGKAQRLCSELYLSPEAAPVRGCSPSLKPPSLPTLLWMDSFIKPGHNQVFLGGGGTRGGAPLLQDKAPPWREALSPGTLAPGGVLPLSATGLLRAVVCEVNSVG